MTKENFVITMMTEITNYNESVSGAIPDHLQYLCLCQSILETGWGKSSLMMNNNAPFGIKATGNKPYYESKTNEYVNGHYETITARFCRYDSLKDAIADYFKLLNAPRYSKVWQTNTFEESAEQIRLCGYATSPTYTTNLIKVYNDATKIIVSDLSAYNAYVNTINDPLNVREKPNTNSRVLTTLPKGTKIKIETEWSYIPELNGFVSNKYIERIEKNG